MPYFPSVPSQRSVPIFQLLLCFFSIFSFSLISLCLGLDMVKASTDEQPLSPVARLFHVPRINCYIVISCKYEAMHFPQPCIVVGAVIFMQRRSMRGVAWQASTCTPSLRRAGFSLTCSAILVLFTDLFGDSESGALIERSWCYQKICGAITEILLGSVQRFCAWCEDPKVDFFGVFLSVVAVRQVCPH